MSTDTDDIRLAFDRLERNQDEVVRFFVRRALGKDTCYEEIGGHIFWVIDRRDPDTGEVYKSKECIASGCELTQLDMDWEAIEPIAEEFDCPVCLEEIGGRL